MLRDLISWRRWLCMTVGLMVSGQTSLTAQAQIMLHPAPDVLRSDFDDSSRRQKPVLLNNAAKDTHRFNQSIAPTTRDRDAEYHQLREEADALDRQFGLVRRIVKFASPSIVHIEATKTSEPGKGFASSRIEEAGAGVVISLRGSAYVLTNRHVIYPAEVSSIRL